MKFCTPDAQLVTVRGESMNGIGEIEKGLTTIFQTRGRSVSLRTLAVTGTWLITAFHNTILQK